MSSNRKIILLGNGMSWSLEGSYQRALLEIGYDASIINIPERLNAKLPFKKIMSRLRNVLDDRRWLIEMNREVAIEILESKPLAIIVFCNAEIIFNTLALLKTASNTKTILIWPDTPFNLTPEVRLSAPLYDLVFTYSKATIPVFNRLGFQNVFWLPLAADPKMHGIEKEPDSFQYDISFIGHWRPEREAAWSAIIKEFSQYRLKITGLFWNENNRDKSILNYLNPTALNGKSYTDFIHQSYINLNIIDHTNYPAANMRFFEVPVANGFQISSACPEQEDIFIDTQDILYFKNHIELCAKIDYSLKNRDEVMDMRKSAHGKVLAKHTYTHRAQEMIDILLKND